MSWVSGDSYSGCGWYPNPNNPPLYPTYPTLNPHYTQASHSSFYNGCPQNPLVTSPTIRGGTVTVNVNTGKIIHRGILPYY